MKLVATADRDAGELLHSDVDQVAVAVERVAAAYAGHEDTSGDTIARCTKVTFEELVAAFEANFGTRLSERGH